MLILARQDRNLIGWQQYWIDTASAEKRDVSLSIIIKTIESCIRSQQTIISLERLFFIFWFEFCEIANRVLRLFTASLFTHAKEKASEGARSTWGGGWGLPAKRESSLPFCTGVQFSRDSLRASAIEWKYEKIEGCEQSNKVFSAARELQGKPLGKTKIGFILAIDSRPLLFSALTLILAPSISHPNTRRYRDEYCTQNYVQWLNCIVYPPLKLLCAIL